MDELTFVPSHPLTLGTELEWQLLDPVTGKLCSQSIALLQNLYQRKDALSEQIIPEGVQNMVEINTTAHTSAQALLEELYELRACLYAPLAEMKLALSGGGTHPFESWTRREVFPKERYLKLNKRYGFLFKRFSVYGQHIHIGCATPDDMLYLIHAFAPYIPHFIALAAASPFYLGVDTSFAASRLTMIDSFPSSGPMPFITRWEHFKEYCQQLRNLKVIESLKDFYWDIRPKPNFGTIEIRVCDSPLSLKKAAAIAAYAQALAAFFLDQRIELNPLAYVPYNYNRFAAMRYGLKANIVDFNQDEPKPLADDILATLIQLKPYAEALGSLELLNELERDCRQGFNEATELRTVYQETGSLVAAVQYGINIWHTLAER